ncbi:MAG: hypothetical protein PHP75_06670, partial [Methylacidiphilaceae bacterium]|nr:hypothetical protein [Candidatus Methylacidiphilaceae bacterium]
MEKQALRLFFLSRSVWVLGGWLLGLWLGWGAAWAEPSEEAYRIVRRLAEQDKRLAERRRQFDYDLI